MILTIINVFRIKYAAPVNIIEKNDFQSDIIKYDNQQNGWQIGQNINPSKEPMDVLKTKEVRLRRGVYKIVIDYNMDNVNYVNINLSSDKDWYAINPNNFYILLNPEIKQTEYKIKIENDEINANFNFNYSGYGNALIKDIKIYKSILEPLEYLAYYLIFVLFLNIFFFYKYKENSEKKSKKIILQIILFSMYILAFVMLFLFFYKKYDNIIDSDMSNQMVLSKFLNEQHKIISKDYFYETELPILSYQIFYSLLFNFTSNWHLVRIIGNIIQLCLLQFTLFYLMKKLNMKKDFFIIGTIFMMPLSYQWFYMGLISTYYTHIQIILFFIIAALLDSIETENKIKKATLLILMSIISLIEGMEGFRSMYVIYVPLVMCAIILYLIERRKNNEINNKILGEIKITSLLLIFSMIGFEIFSKKLKYEYYFCNYKDAKWTNFSIDNFNAIFEDYLTNFGMNDGLIFSSTLISNLCAVLVIVFTITSFIRIIPEKNGYSLSQRIYAIFVLTTLITTIVLFSFSNQEIADRYVMPVALIDIPLILTYFEKVSEINNRQVYKKLAILFISMGIIIGEVNSYGNYYLQFQQNERVSIVNFLIRNNCYQGYARYWDSDVLQELSDGKINTWTWPMGGDISNVNEIFKWGQRKENIYAKPSGKVFIILGSDEDNTITNNTDISYIKYRTQYYKIYIFTNYEEMQENINIQ